MATPSAPEPAPNTESPADAPPDTRADTDSQADTPAGTPAGTRWLDATEQQAWRSFVNGARRLLGQLDADLKVNGIGHDDYGVLVLLSEAPDDRLRMSDLADGVVESRSRLSHHIGRLESRGLVAREACPDDRRGSWAVLTAEGRVLMEQVAPHHVAGVRRWFIDPVDAEQLATVGQAFTAIDNALRGDGLTRPATSRSIDV